MDEVRCEKEKSKSNMNCFGISSPIYEPKVLYLNNAEHTVVFMHALDRINAKNVIGGMKWRQTFFAYLHWQL